MSRVLEAEINDRQVKRATVSVSEEAPHEVASGVK